MQQNIETFFFPGKPPNKHILDINASFETKINWIKKYFNFLNWEERYSQEKIASQLVSSLFGIMDAENNKCKIIAMFPENKNAIRTVKSRENNGYRVWIELNKFHISSTKNTYPIIDFLNEHCRPPDEMWRNFYNHGRYLNFWNFDDNGNISLCGPSNGYIDKSAGITGVGFKEFIINSLDKLAESYPYSFNSNLELEDHEWGCVYFFKKDFMYGDLLKAAQTYASKNCFSFGF